jgi:hypothetical protein
MFGGFPKLFDRAFFIGYFLPGFLMVVGVVANLLVFGYVDEKLIDSIVEKSTAAHALGTTISLVFIWLFSILLTAFNRPIIRLLEGYGKLNPFRIFLGSQKRKFKAQAKPRLKELKNVLNARRRGLSETDQFDELDVWRATRDFPESLDLVLPTRLGNVMRAYERYSGVVYEIEAIVLWSRLLMIIPEKARERIQEVEGLFHFSINMLLASLITLVTWGAMITSALYHGGLSGFENIISWPMILVLVLTGFVAWFNWWRLPDAALQRGEQVKSTFDLYRGELADALGLDLPASEAEERRMWRLVSRRMLLRVSDDRLPDHKGTLDDFRKKKVELRSEDRSVRPLSKPEEKNEELEEESEEEPTAANLANVG